MALTPGSQWSVPSAIDGLNRAQRKILFTSLKNNLVKEIEVRRLAGCAVGQAAYDRGGKSAEGTIIGMAHDFMGSNNLNLLEPRGYFGSRYLGGLDHGKSYHIYTCLSPVTRLLFPEEDDILLNYLECSGTSVEPIWYIPVIPMVLVNGSRGRKSKVPSYNPRDIIANLRRLLNDECVEPMDPWYRGFKGRIEKISTTVEGSTYRTTGVIEVVSETKLHITELPIHCWTSDYRASLQSLLRWNVRDKTEELVIEDIRLMRHDTSIKLELMFDKKNMEIVTQEGLEKKLNLITTVGTTNMYLLDTTGLAIRKYKNPEEILKEFFDLRLEYYGKRKKALLESLDLDLCKIANKARFILGVTRGDINVLGRDRDDMVLELKQKGFAPLPNSSKRPGDGERVISSDYDYLLKTPVCIISPEKVNELYAEMSKLEEKKEEVRRATPRLLWMKDLDALEVELDRIDNAKRAQVEYMERDIRNMHSERVSERKKPAEKVSMVEIVHDKCNEVLLPEIQPSDNVLDSTSGYTGVFKILSYVCHMGAD
uniref:Uncharacterized protein n=1 Tax=Avena sativa TaxID=4498 RepID=A0ACD5ZXR3_AVESA